MIHTNQESIAQDVFKIVKNIPVKEFKKTFSVRVSRATMTGFDDAQFVSSDGLNLKTLFRRKINFY